MVTHLRRFFVRRRLRPVAGTVPKVLSRMFGSKDTYTPAQVRRVAHELKLSAAAQVYAFAACCTDRDFILAIPEKSNASYHQLREEFCQMFDIDDPGFTCNHLRNLRNLPHSNRWAKIENSQIGSYGGAGYGSHWGLH